MKRKFERNNLINKLVVGAGIFVATTMAFNVRAEASTRDFYKALIGEQKGNSEEVLGNVLMNFLNQNLRNRDIGTNNHNYTPDRPSSNEVITVTQDDESDPTDDAGSIPYYTPDYSYSDSYDYSSNDYYEVYVPVIPPDTTPPSCTIEADVENG